MSVVSSTPSISIPSIPMPIPSMPTSIFFSSGGMSFGFNMGSGAPSTSTNPMSGQHHQCVVYLLGGVCLVVLGLFLVNLGVVVLLEDFLFHGLAHLSLGGTSLGGNWGFPFVNTSGPGGFFLGTNFGNIFPGGSTFSPWGKSPWGNFWSWEQSCS
jgi:hypothetical protein